MKWKINRVFLKYISWRYIDWSILNPLSYVNLKFSIVSSILNLNIEYGILNLHTLAIRSYLQSFRHSFTHSFECLYEYVNTYYTFPLQWFSKMEEAKPHQKMPECINEWKTSWIWKGAGWGWRRLLWPGVNGIPSYLLSQTVTVDILYFYNMMSFLLLFQIFMYKLWASFFCCCCCCCCSLAVNKHITGS